MPDALPPMLAASTVAWAPAFVLGMGLMAAVLAALDAVLEARAAGGPVARAQTRPWDVTARLLRQRRRTTVEADGLLWRTSGAGFLVGAVLMVAVVPLGDWTLLPLDVGVVWVNAIDVAVWSLVWLVGWGANAAYSLVGGYRFLAHGLAYELPLMFALVAPPIAAASLDLREIQAAQADLWFVVWMPVAFVVYCLGVLGFSVSGPFSAAIGRDLAGGAFSELSGPDRLVVLAGRHALLVAGSAVAVPLFLGGGAGPVLPAAVWVVVKTMLLAAGLLWLRRRLMVIRPDQFMEVGWVILLPAVVLQDLVVAVVALGGI